MSRLSLLARYAYLAAPCTALFIGASPAGATLPLNNGAETTINAVSEDVEVHDGPGATTTTLNVADGAVIGVNGDDQSLGLFENSMLQMTGGETEGDVILEDNAQAIVTGGAIAGNLEISGNAQFDLGGDGALEGDVEVADAGQFEMNGGVIEGEIVFGDDAVGAFFDGELEDTLVAEGAAVVNVHSVSAGDVEAADDAVINFFDGEAGGSVEAEGDAVINIMGGAFPGVFSDGEAVIATTAAIHITGGVFGEAGLDDGGMLRAGFNGRLTFANAQIAGAADGMAPTATVAAALNGRVDVMSVDFGDLVLECGNNGVINVSDVMAADVTISTIAGGVVNILSGEFESLEVLATLDSFVNISGGVMLDADFEAQSRGVITIRGTSFTYNGQPVGFGAIPQVAGAIAGVLADGSPFSATFRRQFNPVASAGRVVLAAVPEPCVSTLCVFAVAGASLLQIDGRARGIRRRRS